MTRSQISVPALFCFLLTQVVAAADAPKLATAHGTIEKVEKESLTLTVRGADGKFSKPIVLKLTGTSRITVLTAQNRSGKVVLTQKEVDAKSLKTKQVIAVIYATESDENILLSAVADQPVAKKEP